MNTKKTQEVDPRVGQVAEGKKIPFLTEDAIDSSELKVFEFDSPQQLIKIQTPEFSAVCPFSGLPDIADVEILYYPTSGVALELKALKYYFMSFRMVGIYQEGVTKRMFEDLSAILGHKNIEVKTNYNVRGGMYVTCIESGLIKKTI